MYNMKNCDRKNYRDKLCMVKRERERKSEHEQKGSEREKKREKKCGCTKRKYPSLISQGWFLPWWKIPTYIYVKWVRAILMNFSFISVNFIQSSFFNSAHQKRRQIHRLWFSPQVRVGRWHDLVLFLFLSSFQLLELKNRVFESNHFRCYYKVLIRIPQRNSRKKKKKIGINVYSWHMR